MDPHIDPTKSQYQTIKTSLKSVVRNEVIIEKLTNVALMTSRIMTHTLQFMKLYFIHLYDTDQAIPPINRAFNTAVMKIFCDTPTRGRPPKRETVALKATLTEFHNEHYAPIMQDTPMNYKHLNTVIDYMGDEIVTMYENNIKQRFCTYVERFVNVSLRKRERIEAI